jgi:serine/threonine-protein kinase
MIRIFLVSVTSLLAAFTAAPAQNIVQPRDQIALQLGAIQMGYTPADAETPVPFKVTQANMQEACNALVMGRSALDAAVGRPAAKVLNFKDSPEVNDERYLGQLYRAVWCVISSPVVGTLKGSVIMAGTNKKVNVNVKLTAPQSSWTVPVPYAVEAETFADEAAFKAEIAALSQKVSSLTDSLAIVNQNVSTLTSKATTLEKGAETAASTVASLSQNLTNLSTRATAIETNAGTAASTVASLSQNLTTLSTQAASIERSLGTTASSFNRLKTNLLHSGATLDYELTSVTTLAGGKAWEEGGGTVDGTGADASFSGQISSPVLDGSGNLYIIDQRRIRKITPAGVVSTLAGSDEYGSEDGKGSAATFGDSISGSNNLKVDASGTLFLLDEGKVRKVTLDGVVTTMEIGTADSPIYCSNLVTDGIGNLYAVGVDYFNNTSKLLKISVSGEVTTFASPESAESGERLGSKDGALAEATILAGGPMAADGKGNLYLMEAWQPDPENAPDTYAPKIRKVAPTGVVTTVGLKDLTNLKYTSEFDNPFYNIAVDPTGNLFIDRSTESSDMGFLRSTIKVAPDGMVTTFLGSGPIESSDGGDRLSRPRDGAGSSAGLGSGYFGFRAIDNFGNLYYADSGLVRKATSAGVVSTLAGGGWGEDDGDGYQSQFQQINGIVVDNAGNVYVLETHPEGSDEFPARIRKITVSP